MNRHHPYEPVHDKTNKMSCTFSKDSDQHVHPPSLIRGFARDLRIGKDPMILLADSDDSGQTGRMSRLI